MRSYSVEIIFNNDEDKQRLLDLLQLEIQIWNRCSQMVFDNHPPLGLKLIHHLCYYTLRKEFPEAPAQLVVRIEKGVSSIFLSIMSNKHEMKKAPTKKNLSIQLDKRLFSFKKDSTIAIATLGRIGPLSNGTPALNRIFVSVKLYPKIIEMFSKHKASDPLIFVRDNKIFLSFAFETPEPGILLDPKATGVDLGIKNLAVTSEGIIYSDKKYLTRKRRLRHLKRKLASKGTKSSRKHLKRVRRKEQNSTKNMCHHLSKKTLMESCGNVIVLENLRKIKSKKRSHRFNNRQSQVPYFMIKQFLTYKAPLFGKRVETVSPAYRSKGRYENQG